nr:hypothetical protein [Tanacetum cinerariifolium]
SQVFTHAMFDCDDYLSSGSDESLPPSPIYDRYQSGNGYHVVPPPHTGTFMPPKPDLVLNNAPNAIKTDHYAFTVKLSPTKPAQDLSHTNRPLAPIINDWVSDSEDESKTKTPQNVSSFVQSTKQVTRPRHAKPIVTKINSTPKWHINRSPSLKASNSPPRVTAIQAPVVNAAHGIQGKWEWKPKCPILDYVSRNTSASMTLKRLDYNDALGRSKLHMDLFGPTFVKSLNKKSYCLVVTNDYSRFTWVFFLANKDETSPILETFITCLENQLSLKVKVIKSDNGTEFKNNDLNQFCRMKGIKREFSVPRTPQQNGIAKRKNRTLIEATRTMLADSPLPIPFWAEAVNTACKFDGKDDEGFLVGYSVSSKDFKVFNSRTRIIQETLHVNFLENKPNVVGSGPTWLFDIDTLTKTMNYQPVTVGNQSNPSAGFQDKFDVEKAGEDSDQQYVLFPVWSSGSTNPQNTNGDAAFDEKEPEFDEKKPESEVNVSPSSSAQSRKHDDKTKREAKGKSPVESLTGYKNLSSEFEDFSDNNINEDNAVDTLVPSVGQISPNSTNTFSVAGPSNATASPTHGKYSCIDTSQLLDDPNMPEFLIPTTRVHKDQPVTQIIGDLSLATQTRSITRVAKDQGGLSQMFNDDFHTCMFACFLSQEEPKRVHQALKDPS